jgi:hypothetical protein
MLVLSLLTMAAILQPGVSAAGAATTITVFPADPPNTGNCYPFGIGVAWTPFAGFVYKNIPAFELRPGDTLAFDTNAVNNVDVQLEIALSRTTANGNDILAAPYFTTVVTNTQTPLNPRGDTVQGIPAPAISANFASRVSPPSRCKNPPTPSASASRS